jgi:D-glycero-D-manno-heptose 1,7-bisphosphate phosphatase
MGINKVALSSAIFLDRDGVLNRNVLNPSTGEYESPGRPEDFRLAQDVMPALSALQSAGFRLFLVSNQPNYAKGKSTLEELQAVHERLLGELRRAQIQFSAFYYCFHHPRGINPEYSGSCECRKPSPYFLLKARDEFAISLTHSWMVGDRVTDIECGVSAGVRTIRVEEDHPAVRPAGEMQADFEAKNLTDAVRLILANTEDLNIGALPDGYKADTRASESS